MSLTLGAPVMHVRTFDSQRADVPFQYPVLGLPEGLIAKINNVSGLTQRQWRFVVYKDSVLLIESEGTFRSPQVALEAIGKVLPTVNAAERSTP